MRKSEVVALQAAWLRCEAGALLRRRLCGVVGAIEVRLNPWRSRLLLPVYCARGFRVFLPVGLNSKYLVLSRTS